MSTPFRSRHESEAKDSDSIPTVETVDGVFKPDAESVTKSFHTTISKDWTDQEALEAQRLVALQGKSCSGLSAEPKTAPVSPNAYRQHFERIFNQDLRTSEIPETNVSFGPDDSIRPGDDSSTSYHNTHEGASRDEETKFYPAADSTNIASRYPTERRSTATLRAPAPFMKSEPSCCICDRDKTLTSSLAHRVADMHSDRKGFTNDTSPQENQRSGEESMSVLVRQESRAGCCEVPLRKASTLSSSLNANDPRKDDPAGKTLVEQLYGELETLRKDNRALEGLLRLRRVRWQAIYRVHRLVPKSTHADNSAKWLTYSYLDEPHWIKGDRGVASLQGNLPVSSVESYQERNPEIVFVVFRSFKINESKQDEEDQDRVVWSESIRLTSPDLIKAVNNANYDISKSLEGHSRTDIIKTKTELPAPYLPFFHYRHTLENCNTNILEDPRREWQLLLHYVFESCGDEYMQVDRWLKSGNIPRTYTKYLIKYNDILLSKASGHLCGYRAVSQPHLDLDVSKEFQQAGKKPSKDEYDSQRWKVWTEAWKFDGNFHNDRKEIIFNIPSGRDEILSIRDLDLVPVQYAEPQSVVWLRDRGFQFWKSRSRRYISYRSQRDTENSSNTDLRYMIDPVTYKKLHNNNAKPLEDGLGAALFSAEKPPMDPFPLLLPATIKGFNMRNKKWEELDVDRICDVCWNTEAFDNLVIDETTRKLIKALVMRQLEADKGTDLIAGKGRGLIILLHGGPGTGKTFTAESVAEIANKPLYRVSCGDLGTDPTKVEEYLESVLYLGKIWDCVVLLDEADVYLEQRSMESLARNALVSVFLRVIEYYEGILILTSNRVGTFDEAFKSRLQLALHYEKLKLKDRRKIWENFIKRLETLEETGVDFDDLYKHVNDLAKHELNGRQIRNAITTARQLALYEEKDLDFDDLQQVIKVALKFDKYTTDIQEGRTDDEVMRSEGVRA